MPFVCSNNGIRRERRETRIECIKNNIVCKIKRNLFFNSSFSSDIENVYKLGESISIMDHIDMFGWTTTTS